jgi:hypothetical protein
VLRRDRGGCRWSYIPVRRALQDGLLTDGGQESHAALVTTCARLKIQHRRTLHHVTHLVGNPQTHRFCNLVYLPGRRTASRWLQRFSRTSVEGLCTRNADVVAHAVRLLTRRALSLDVGGTGVSTGLTVKRAFRGYNPHHRKVPSCFRITAHLAETGHLLRVKSRSGNINDGKANLPLLRALFAHVADTLGRGLRLQFRMDGDFFKETVLRLLIARGAGCATKVPFWRWLDLQRLIRECRRWRRVTGEVGCFEAHLPLKP